MGPHTNGDGALTLERYVTTIIDTDIRDEFAAALIDVALEDAGLVAPPKRSDAYRLLLERIASADLPLTGPGAAAAVVRDLNEIRETGLLLSRVEAYADAKEIDPERFTAGVKRSMVTYLQDLGVRLDDDDRFTAGGYDEYLALAYASAIRTAGGSADPIVAARLKSAPEPWDFTVKFYDDAESQGVVQNFILAAGALDYVFHIGDAMGALRLASHVQDLWEHGIIDVGEDTEAKIFAYGENALQRGTEEDRGRHYRRVLSLGNAKVMDGVVVNEAFPHLWQRLMTECAKYIEKREMHESDHLSRRPIYQGIADLQYNLSEFGGGGTAKVAQKLNAQLEDAMAILGADEVIEQLALGRRKSVWRVVERLRKDIDHRAVGVSALRTLAEEGNRIFQYLAYFDTTTSDAAFEDFLGSAEAWILAESGAMDPSGETPSVDDQKDDFAIEGDGGEQGDSGDEDW